MARSDRARAVVALLATLIAAAAALLAAVLVGSASSGEAAQSTTFMPAADAHVRSDRATRNFGQRVHLRAGAAPTAVSYLRFDLTGSAPVTNATLKLFTVSPAGSSGIAVRKVNDSRWSESEITYSTAPPVGEIVGRTGAFGEYEWISLDVTSAVKGGEPVTLALTTTSTNSRWVASSEVAAKPRLVAELAPPPPPGPQPSPGAQPSFPIRAAFYYPWFPEAWSQQGMSPYTKYTPSLGFYRSNDSAVIQKHVRELEYAGVEAGISSWWGQGTKEDARLPLLLSETNKLKSALRWAPYYEEESLGDPSSQKIEADLSYIKSRYVSDPAYLRVNGRPVIFVFSTGSDVCGMAQRWKTANASQNFHVVLKVFSGYANCSSQPDSWHQYAPAGAAHQHAGSSYAISPGFNKADEGSARLGRDISRFQKNVRDMVASGEPWQLVTTFNEWGEGTSVESAAEWDSSSGHGQYLDALRNNGQPVAGPPSPPSSPPPSTPPPSSPPPSLPPSGADPVVAAAGDISCAQGADGSSSCRDQATSDLVMANLPDRVLTLGDQQYESGALSGFQSYYDPTWGRFKDRTSPATGNHDPFSSGYSAYFGSRATARHYAFDLGSWRVYSLDSNSPDSSQVNWLKSDLAANPRTCVLAFWHHPRFSSGTTHGNNGGVGPFWQALYDAGADVVLNGHEHNYERFAPQSPSATADQARGIRQFVAGTGGRGLYPLGAPEPNSEVRNSSTLGVLELTLRPSTYEWRFRPVTGGSFADTGSDGCH